MPILPSRRLAGLIALAAAAFLVGTSAAMVVDGLLLAAVVAEAVLLYGSPLPQVERTLPPRVPLGGSVQVSVVLRAAGAMPQRVVWTDDAGPGLRRAGADPRAARLPARGGVSATYELRGAARGRTALGDLHLRVLGPLGLLWRQWRVPRRDPVVVQPGLYELHRHRALALHHRLELGRRRIREVGEGREFERLREYVRGDDPRRIDWKATGRRAQLIVRQYEAERSQSVLLAIDAGRLMRERFGDRERLDHALAAALVLADAAAVHGDAVGILVFADTVQSYLPPGRHPLARVADVFAGVEARRMEPDYPLAFRYLARQLRRRSLVVLFTDVIDAQASAALLAHLGASARRHLPLVVAMRNPELEDRAGAPVQEEAEAFQRAAAEELLQARAVALARVRRQGVLVADVRPEATVGEALARYLEIKRRGLL